MQRLLGAALALAIVAAPALAQTGGSTVRGSAHDFTASGLNPAFNFYTRSSGICSTCHTAHNAYNTDAPLWIHDTTSSTFDVYDSPTLNATPGQPQGVTKACLACHDGTVAVNAIGGGIHNATGTTGITTAVYIASTDAGYIGTDLSNDHPVSIQYNEGTGAGQDPGLRPKADATVYFPLFGPANDQVECSSCHNPHVPGTNNLFFRSYLTYATTGTNTDGYASRCNVCHIK